MKMRILPCMLIMLLAATSAAQEKPGVSTTLRLLSYGNVLHSWSYAAPGEGKFAASGALPTIPNRFRSKPVKYQGPAKLWLFDGPLPAINRDAPMPVPSAAVDLPPGCKNALLVIFPVPDAAAGAPKFVAAALNDDLAPFPYGTFQFFNLTQHDLVGTIGDQTFELSKGQRRVVKPGVAQGGMNVTVFDPRDKARPLMQQVWDYQPKSRVVVFLREIAKPRPYLAVASVTEFEGTVEEPAAEPAGPLDVQTLSEQNTQR